MYFPDGRFPPVDMGWGRIETDYPNTGAIPLWYRRAIAEALEEGRRYREHLRTSRTHRDSAWNHCSTLRC